MKDPLNGYGMGITAARRRKGPGDGFRSSTGGVLLDLFLIALITAALIAGCVVAWLAWRNGSSAPFLRRILSKISSPSAALGREEPSVPDIDVSDRAAWIQARVRDLLSSRGVAEKNVVETYNVQRQEKGIRWLEDTLVVRRPAAFEEKGFLSALGSLLAERKLSLMEDRRDGTRWVLALGDRKRVYQRLIVEGEYPDRRRNDDR